MRKWKRSEIRVIRIALAILSIAFVAMVGLLAFNATPQEINAFLSVARRIVLG